MKSKTVFLSVFGSTLLKYGFSISNGNTFYKYSDGSDLFSYITFRSLFKWNTFDIILDTVSFYEDYCIYGNNASIAVDLKAMAIPVYIYSNNGIRSMISYNSLNIGEKYDESRFENQLKSILHIYVPLIEKLSSLNTIDSLYEFIDNLCKTDLNNGIDYSRSHAPSTLNLAILLDRFDDAYDIIVSKIPAIKNEIEWRKNTLHLDKTEFDRQISENTIKSRVEYLSKLEKLRMVFLDRNVNEINTIKDAIIQQANINSEMYKDFFKSAKRIRI